MPGWGWGRERKDGEEEEKGVEERDGVGVGGVARDETKRLLVTTST